MDALDDRWVLDCEQTQEEESEIVPESDWKTATLPVEKWAVL